MASNVAAPEDLDMYSRSGSQTGLSSDRSSLSESLGSDSSEQPSRDASNKSPHHLEVSFYYEPEHLLDIRTVDTPDLLFARALTILQPLDESYAMTKYEQAFNWSSVFAYLRELSLEAGYAWTKHEFYVVEFRSKLQENIDRELLFKLDKESHREATQSGGLLKYWYGSPDAHRRNLATCLWRSKEDAIEGGKGIWHKQARDVISKMYEDINVKGLTLIVEDDLAGWSFAPFSFH